MNLHLLIFGVILSTQALLTQGLSSVPTNGVESEKRILARLHHALPKHTPPRDMVNKTVYLSLDLYHIVDVDEKNGILTVKLTFFMYYYTPSASWNESELGEINTIAAPSDTFWTPDVGKKVFIFV